MDDRFSKVAARPEPEKENSSGTKLLESFAAIIVVVATASAIYAAVRLLPTVLHAILREVGTYIAPMAGG